jgi:hypothetical protein
MSANSAIIQLQRTRERLRISWDFASTAGSVGIIPYTVRPNSDEVKKSPPCRVFHSMRGVLAGPRNESMIRHDGFVGSHEAVLPATLIGLSNKITVAAGQ